MVTNHNVCESDSTHPHMLNTDNNFKRGSWSASRSGQFIARERVPLPCSQKSGWTPKPDTVAEIYKTARILPANRVARNHNIKQNMEKCNPSEKT
jgi:hypothetical protein